MNHSPKKKDIGGAVGRGDIFKEILTSGKGNLWMRKSICHSIHVVVDLIDGQIVIICQLNCWAYLGVRRGFAIAEAFSIILPPKVTELYSQRRLEGFGNAGGRAECEGRISVIGGEILSNIRVGQVRYMRPLIPFPV